MDCTQCVHFIVCRYLKRLDEAFTNLPIKDVRKAREWLYSFGHNCSYYKHAYSYKDNT